MTKREFYNLYEYLQELYDLKQLSKQGYEAWYTIFEKIDNDVANKMVDLYFLNNNKKPKPSDLLQYRNVASNQLKKCKEDIAVEKCSLCNGVGVVIIERLKDGHYYQFANACTCSNGLNYAFLKTVDLEELSNLRYARSKYTEMTLEEEKAWLDGLGKIKSESEC